MPNTDPRLFPKWGLDKLQEKIDRASRPSDEDAVDPKGDAFISAAHHYAASMERKNAPKLPDKFWKDGYKYTIALAGEIFNNAPTHFSERQYSWRMDKLEPYNKVVLWVGHEAMSIAQEFLHEHRPRSCSVPLPPPMQGTTYSASQQPSSSRSSRIRSTSAVRNENYLEAQTRLAMNISSPPAKIVHKPKIHTEAEPTGVARLQTIPPVPTKQPNRWSTLAASRQVGQPPNFAVAAAPKGPTAVPVATTKSSPPSRIPHGKALPKAQGRRMVTLGQAPSDPEKRTLGRVPTTLPRKAPMAVTGPRAAAASAGRR